jgi:hypothetical protein
MTKKTNYVFDPKSGGPRRASLSRRLTRARLAWQGKGTFLSCLVSIKITLFRLPMVGLRSPFLSAVSIKSRLLGIKCLKKSRKRNHFLTVITAWRGVISDHTKWRKPRSVLCLGTQKYWDFGCLAITRAWIG